MPAKPRMFVGSSVERLNLAYAVQEGLEHDLEITVWSQGIFELSRSAMASLADALEESDFALFIFAPDDLTKMRNTEKQAVRDNVIFELGMFIGKLTIDRCFILAPRGIDDLHLPSDLLGLTPATYEPDRQDGNLVAALGPACNRVRRAVAKLGPRTLEGSISSSVVLGVENLTSDPTDCIALMQSWMGSRSTGQNMSAIRFTDVDRELALAPGSAEKYIEQAAARWNYVADRRGLDIILFKPR